VASARHVASEIESNHLYLQMVRDATAQTYVLHQRAALHALEDFSCGILEVSPDETEMGVEVHGANIKD
ncbi:unnamed protein product, partial [Prorocentrum cordatum]